jgi:hypothetical protein
VLTGRAVQGGADVDPDELFATLPIAVVASRGVSGA